jgi:iron(III) transport system substrate-binding protein
MRTTTIARVVLGATLFALLGCSAPQTPAPKAADPKPAETKPAAMTAPAASPAASPSPAAGASPSPATAASPSPAASPSTAAAAPAASPAPAAAFDTADEAAARAEGSVTWYTSTPLRQAQLVAEAFERRYGFKVEVFRTGGEQVIQRFLTEASAGRVAADLVTASDPAAFNAMIRNNQLERFRPQFSDRVPASARDDQGYWVAQRLNMAGMAYRDDQVSAADAPRKWTDVTDPRYRGKLVHADPSFTAIASQIVGTLARRHGWEYYEALKRNDMMIVQGHQQLAQTLVTGERSVGAEAGDSDIWDARRRGSPVTMVYPEDGTFVIPAPTAVARGAPHPNAARLLAQFMLSDEAQGLFPQEGYYAARLDLPPPEGNPRLEQLSLIDVDLEYIDQNDRQIKQRFGDIFS